MATARAQIAVEQLPTAETLAPAAAVQTPTAPGLPPAGSPVIAPPPAPAMDAQASALMDQAYGPALRDQVTAQSSAGSAMLAGHDQAVAVQVGQSHDATRQAQQETVSAQLAERSAAAAAVAERRESWRGEQSAVAGEYAQQVGGEQAAAQSDVTTTMSTARTAAESELSAAGRQADAAATAASGAAVQQVPVQRSWWSRVKGAVSDGLSAVGSGIRAVGSAAADLYYRSQVTGRCIARRRPQCGADAAHRVLGCVARRVQQRCLAAAERGDSGCRLDPGSSQGRGCPDDCAGPVSGRSGRLPREPTPVSTRESRGTAAGRARRDLPQGRGSRPAHLGSREGALADRQGASRTVRSTRS